MKVNPGDVCEIYRVENADGHGPYCDAWDWQTVTHNNTTGRPGPAQDGINISAIERAYEYMEFFFGFKCKTQAHKWFTKKELVNLEKRGYFMKKVVGRIIAVGQKQVVFTREKYIETIHGPVF